MTITIISPGTVKTTEGGGISIDGWTFDCHNKPASVRDTYLALGKWLAENGLEKEARLVLKQERAMRK